MPKNQSKVDDRPFHERVALVPITEDNFEEVRQLEVHRAQVRNVGTVDEAMAESAVFHDLIPVAIYADEKPVGLLMFSVGPEKVGRGTVLVVHVDRLLVDKDHQGHGYGPAALLRLAKLAPLWYPRASGLSISVNKDNSQAVKAYKAVGFGLTQHSTQAGVLHGFMPLAR